MDTRIDLKLKQIASISKSIAILKLIDRKKALISNYEKKLEIERGKRYIESFLLTPEKWYVEQIEICKKDIEYLEMRYKNN